MRFFKSAIFAILVSGAPAFGSTFNGDFSNGLDGFTPLADTNLSGTQDPANFVGIKNNGANPYAQLLSDPELEALVLFISLQKTFTVTAATSLLSFDYGFVFDTENLGVPSDFVSSFNRDRFSVQVRDLDAAGTIFDLGIYTLFDSTLLGTQLDPFGNAGGLNVAMDDASDPFFDSSVSADLSSLIGHNLELTFTLRDFFDGRQTGIGIDNIHLSALDDPNVVPLPASLWMLLAAFGALGIQRRRHAA